MDKIVDVFKEFGLIVMDVFDVSIEIYVELGLSYSKIVVDINSGKMIIVEVFELVIKKLNEVKGVVDKICISVVVFGGVGEDMVVGLVGIDLIKIKFKDL